MKMKVLMFLNCLNSAGGVEQYVVSLLPALRLIGTEIILCLEIPPDRDNQYYRQLTTQGFRVHYPRIGPFPVYGWCWLIDALLWLLFPITAIVLMVDRLLRSRSWSRSYTGLRGRLNNMVKSLLPEWVQKVPVWCLLTWLWLRNRPNLIHVLRVDGVPALQWSLKLGLRTIYTEALEPGGDVYYPHLSNFYRTLEGVAPRIPVIITQSERVQKSIQQNWHTECNIRVLPWVVTVPRSHNTRSHSKIGRIVFGSAGRLSPEKNIETFLEAAKLLKMEYPDQVNFVVAGGGPAEQSLKLYAKEMGLEKDVHFIGPYALDSLPQVFAQFDVFVISSLTEGAPLAVMEAMAYGKPVVATDVAGTGELVLDGVTGFLVPPQDAHGLAAACRKFITDPQLIDRMGQKAIERYQLLYSPAAGARKLHELYTELCTS
jgi:glycosyltransferase involved in cell wall biosynthesis